MLVYVDTLQFCGCPSASAVSLLAGIDSSFGNWLAVGGEIADDCAKNRPQSAVYIQAHPTDFSRSYFGIRTSLARHRHAS